MERTTLLNPEARVAYPQEAALVHAGAHPAEGVGKRSVSRLWTRKPRGG